MSSEQDRLPSLEHTAEAAPAWQLAVLGGLHAGALVEISADDWTLVGSAEDCDIVLRDGGVLPHHAALFPRAGQLQLRAIDGPLSALEQSHAPGSAIMLADATTWQIQGVTLGVGLADSAAWQALRAQPLPPSSNAVDGDEHAALHSGAQLDNEGPLGGDADADADAPTMALPARVPLHRQLTRKAQQVLAGVAACAVVLGVGTVVWGVIGQKVQARETSNAIANVLSTLRMPELRVVEAANGHARIEGVVRSESERSQLMRALQQRGVYPAVDVATGEQLAATVQNSFRQRGLHVKAHYTGVGRVEVQGAAPSPLTEQAITEVLSATNAVTQVALLDAAAPTPDADAAATAAAAAPAPKANSSGNDPKRVVGVVGGANPFVVTADRRHYFIGSMLPDGTQIDKIVGHTVDFSRQGKSTTVTF